MAIKEFILGVGWKCTNIFDLSICFLLRKISYCIALVFRLFKKQKNVLHISYAVHVPYYTTRILREHGYSADYLSVGKSFHWKQYDFLYQASGYPILRHLKEFWYIWHIMAKYHVIHSHFMLTISQDGWEIPVLKKAGCKLVVHFRGCEARDRKLNMKLHPNMNICQNCDYIPHICELPVMEKRRKLATQYSDLTLVTTPDMHDFVPEAIHFPFFSPVQAVLPTSIESEKFWPNRQEIKIVHATNHPGIEGTEEIKCVIQSLQKKGYKINFVFLQGVALNQVVLELVDADISIGKMKMGYYANAQIEAMSVGVPTITCIRPEFITEEIRSSGFILSSLTTLEEDLLGYLNYPEKLLEKRLLAKKSIEKLHNNDALAKRLIKHYTILTNSEV